jgi:hypothetical protein
LIDRLNALYGRAVALGAKDTCPQIDWSPAGWAREYGAHRKTHAADAATGDDQVWLFRAEPRRRRRMHWPSAQWGMREPAPAPILACGPYAGALAAVMARTPSEHRYVVEMVDVRIVGPGRADQIARRTAEAEAVAASIAETLAALGIPATAAREQGSS